MTAPAGRFYWNGVEALLSASFTLSHGVSPSTATLYIAPQGDTISPWGDLLLEYGGTSLYFPDCVITECNLIVERDGRRYLALNILDGRWRWQYSKISGRYNHREPDEKITKGTKKSARELGKLLFEAMGVRRADVGALPNNAFPLKDWDYDRADLELSSLCSEFGCRVIYGPGDFVGVAVEGIGDLLPLNDAVLDNSLGIAAVDRPEWLVFVGAKDQYQWDFELEGVGKEPDGEIKLIDDLSYAPQGGWIAGDEPDWEIIKNLRHRELAQECIYKMYRIKTPEKIFDVKIKNLEQILPLFNHQVQKAHFSGEQKIESELEPWIYGLWWPGNEDNENSGDRITGNLKVDLRQLYTEGFSVDVEHGIVIFSGTTWYQDAEFRHEEARLKLRIAVGIRDPITGGWIHREVKRKLPGDGSGTKYIKREDIAYKQWYDFETNKKKNNLKGDDGFEAAAKYYLDVEERLLNLRTPGSATWAGFMPIRPDGAIQQVRWQVDDEGYATTQASRNTENPGYGVSNKDRVFFNRQIEAAQATALAKKRAARAATRNQS